MTERSFPLYWPEGWPRAKSQKRANFKDRSVMTGHSMLDKEIKRFGGRDLIISTNVELRLDGTPRSGQKQPADKGVAIFFQRNKEPIALACDVYSTVEDNLWALVRTLEAFRQIERDGSPTLVNRAFKGFKALPDPEGRPWFEVMGVREESSFDVIKAAYIQLAKVRHPDGGGSNEAFDQLQKAFDQAKVRHGV